MAKAFKLPDWKQWLRVAQPNNAPAILSRKHIYILPTRYGWLFLVVLLAMLLGSINYTLSLGFVLTFLLAGMGNMAMLHSWRNLVHLSVESVRAEPVFAGEDAVFDIRVTDSKPRPRYAVAAHFEPEKKTGKKVVAEPIYSDITAAGQVTLKLKLPTKKRGWLQAGRVTFFTEFPLSLFHVWAYVGLGNQNNRCLVYPHPALSSLPLPASAEQGAAGALDSKSGDDDFAGHRNYQYGDSPRRVDWKASSREQGLLTKQFQGEAQSTLWLDWSLTPGNDVEQRIRQLTRWVVDANTDRQSYGLRLPKLEIAPGTGEGHYRQCLQALALLEI
ncbi:MAG TPA: DUF58 domain-containing protein [Methylophilaceae bacterium]|nr:DUF58 domain-containing protein [Methylophilaceae bacterium]